MGFGLDARNAKDFKDLKAVVEAMADAMEDKSW